MRSNELNTLLSSGRPATFGVLTIFGLLWALALQLSFCSQAQAQDIGTSFGVPNSSPPILWPRGMSLETLSPKSLYPNGPQFGLSNTSGGFGLSGTGPQSGVGLAERTVSPIVTETLSRADDAVTKSILQLNNEEIKSASTFGALLSTQYRREMANPNRSALSRRASERFEEQTLPGVDKILHDQPFTTDSILKDPLSGQ